MRNGVVQSGPRLEINVTKEAQIILSIWFRWLFSSPVKKSLEAFECMEDDD